MLMKLSSFSMIKKLSIVAIAGLILAACANTMEGVGKDLQTMGNSMGGKNQANTNNTNTNNNQSQTQGKDVVVTPVK
jgi:predicted small secreted protein